MDLVDRKKMKGIDLLEISLILVMLTMPYKNTINSYAVVLFSIVAIFTNNVSQKMDYLRRYLLYWILPGLYFITLLLQYFFDSGIGKSTVLLETNTSLIAIPIILCSMRKLGDASLKKIMLSFVLSNILGSFYCIYKAYIEFKASDHSVNLLFYHHLSGHIGINAIYYSMYCLFSLLALLYFYFFEKAARRSKVFAFLAIAYLAFFMIFLSSKMFIFLLCLAGIAVIAYSFFQSRQLRKSSLSILALCIIIPILILKIPYSKSRIEYTQVKKYEGAEDNNNGLAVRGVLWKSAWDIIKEQHYLLGKGHYATQGELRLRYLNAGFVDGAIKNYNSHDQYLYTWACYGLFSLFVLLIFLFWFFWVTIKRRIFLGVFLSSIFIIANITECMFETQKGLVFFLFFSGLLLFHGSPLSSIKGQSRLSHE